MLQKIIEASKYVQLNETESGEIDSFVANVAERHPGVDSGVLTQAATNIRRYYSAVNEANSGLYAADIDTFADISQIVTAKFFVGSVLNELASTQPLENPYGHIYRLTFEYADTHVPAGVTAGQALSAVRTTQYATDPGEDVIPRKLKAELRSTLVEAKLRPLDLSSTFQSLLRRASVYGKNNSAVFNNQFLNAAYGKLRDELELGAIQAIDAAVPAANVVSFADPTLIAGIACTELECEYHKIHDTVAEASRRVYDKTGYYPNALITGPEGLAMMDKWIKTPGQNMTDPAALIPQRGRIGVFAKRWIVYYDPSLASKIIAGVFEPSNPMNNPLVYAPYITLAVTPEIMDRDLSTSQVVFAVDRVDVTEPEFFARVDIA